MASSAVRIDDGVENELISHLALESPDDELEELQTKKIDSIKGGKDNRVVTTVRGPTRHSFTSCWQSSIVQIIAGSGEGQKIFRAHQTLLTKSRFLQEQFSRIEEGPSKSYQLNLSDETVGVVGSLIEFLYTGEYFPKTLKDPLRLESDQSSPLVDATGEQLLLHGRIYCLARKLGLADLGRLAHKKAQLVNTTVKAALVYARFVYANIPAEDVKVRRSIVKIWANHGDSVRHRAEQEFKKMCLDHPAFAYDVLEMVLDQKESMREELLRERSSVKRSRTSTLAIS